MTKIENKRGPTVVETNSVREAINVLTEQRTVRTSEPVFNKVISKLRTNYAGLLIGRNATINYSNYEISLK